MDVGVRRRLVLVVAAFEAMSTYPPSTREQAEEPGDSGDSLKS